MPRDDSSEQNSHTKHLTPCRGSSKSPAPSAGSYQWLPKAAAPLQKVRIRSRTRCLGSGIRKPDKAWCHPEKCHPEVAEPLYGPKSSAPVPVSLQGSWAPRVAPKRELTAVMEGFFPSPAGG